MKKDRLRLPGPEKVAGGVAEIVCCPLHLAYRLLARPWLRERYATKMKEDELQRIAPPPPEERKRVLSISLAEPTQSTTDAQTDSSLFRLPAELRNKIYTEYMEYMSYKEICVYRIDGRFRACGRRGPQYRAVGMWPLDLLPLLMTCRKVYTEAIPLLYSIPTFCFQTPTDFLSFSASILPQRVRLLSRVRMGTGEASMCCRLPLEVSGRFDYRNLPRPAHILSQLPAIEPPRRESAWLLSCRLISAITGVKFLSVSIEAPAPMERWHAMHDSLLHGLHFLPRHSMDVDISWTGKHVKKIYRWHSDEEEVLWTEPNGQVLWRRKCDATRTWMEEWSVMKREMIDRLGLGL